MASFDSLFWCWTSSFLFYISQLTVNNIFMSISSVIFVHHYSLSIYSCSVCEASNNFNWSFHVFTFNLISVSLVQRREARSEISCLFHIFYLLVFVSLTLNVVVSYILLFIQYEMVSVCKCACWGIVFACCFNVSKIGYCISHF